SSSTDDSSQEKTEQQPLNSGSKTREENQIVRFVDKIFTPDEKQEKRQQKVNLQYRLGSLFFLMLEKPDSAAFYYKKVIKYRPYSSLTPKALFALYKLHLLEDNIERSRYYKKRILQDYGHSIYAKHLSGHLAGANEKIRRSFTGIMNDSISAATRAKKLEQLALDNDKSPLAARIYLRAIELNIKAAKLAKDSIDYTARKWNKVRTMIVDYGNLFPEAEASKQLKVWEKWLSEKNRRQLVRN